MSITSIGQYEFIAQIAGSDPAQEISKLKEQPGRNIAIYGSGSIVPALTRTCQIDECRLIIDPVRMWDTRPGSRFGMPPSGRQDAGNDRRRLE